MKLVHLEEPRLGGCLSHCAPEGSLGECMCVSVCVYVWKCVSAYFLQGMGEKHLSNSTFPLLSWASTLGSSNSTYSNRNSFLPSANMLYSPSLLVAMQPLNLLGLEASHCHTFVSHTIHGNVLFLSVPTTLVHILTGLSEVRVIFIFIKLFPICQWKTLNNL